MRNDFFVDSEHLSETALAKKHKIEGDPSCRTDHMTYMLGMEQIKSDIREKVMIQMEQYDYSVYTEKDVVAALQHEFYCRRF